MDWYSNLDGSGLHGSKSGGQPQSSPGCAPWYYLYRLVQGFFKRHGFKLIALGLLTVACIIWKIPTVHPRRISTKIAAKLAEIEYVHANATRMPGSVRKVLRIPCNNMRVDLDRASKDVGERRDENLLVKAESSMALSYLRNLVQDISKQKTAIEGLEFEAHSQT